MSMKIASVVTQASGVLSTLYLLRGSRIAQAMELLEQELDSSVVDLDRLAEHLTSSDRERIVETLRSILGYRQLYPERPTADMEGIPEKLIADQRKIQDRAKGILDNLA